MPFPYISGKVTEPPQEPRQVDSLPETQKIDPKYYEMDTDLVDAVNVALLLGKPLLLTGDPGTGKTQLAYRVAWELGWGEPIRFDTKSTSTARDVLYRYDTLRRFHAANTKEGSQKNLDYLDFEGLGKAIVLSQPKDTVQDILPPTFTHTGPKRSVVLVDEIDKAPRDFPNDLLLEVDTKRFRIPELENREVQAAPKYLPALILTSNSEQNLPDAFLRRCVYFHISDPGPIKLAKIVRGRLPGMGTPEKNSPLLDSALQFFEQIKSLRWRKRPATAELLDWVQTLQGLQLQPHQKLHEVPEALMQSLGTLAKTKEDLKEILEPWVKAKKYQSPA